MGADKANSRSFGYYQLCCLIVLLCSSLSFLSCGKDQETARAASGNIAVKDMSDPKNQGQDAEAGAFAVGNLSSQAAFEEQMFPLLREHCSSCHGEGTSPFFAVDDAAKAHRVVVEAHLVAPTAIPSSRFVTRLALNNHNCWSECPADALAMQDAISAWIARAAIKDGGEGLIKLGALRLADAEEIRLTGGHGNWVREAENYDALSQAFDVREDATASGKKAIAASGSSQQANFGEIAYEFPIPEGTGYQLWARLKRLDGGGHIAFRFNGGERRDEFLGVSEQWTWHQLADNLALSPLKRSGVVDFAIIAAEVAVDMLAVTSEATFDRSLVENTGYRFVLRFDLSEVLGFAAELILHRSVGPTSGSWILSHPSLLVPGGQPVAVQGLYILVNQHYNPQYSTFAGLDVVSGGASTELSPRGLVITAPADNDTISLGFRRLEALLP